MAKTKAQKKYYEAVGVTPKAKKIIDKFSKELHGIPRTTALEMLVIAGYDAKKRQNGSPQPIVN